MGSCNSFAIRSCVAQRFSTSPLEETRRKPSVETKVVAGRKPRKGVQFFGGSYHHNIHSTSLTHTDRTTERDALKKVGVIQLLGDLFEYNLCTLSTGRHVDTLDFLAAVMV